MRKSAAAKRIEDETKAFQTWQMVHRIEDLFKEVNRESRAAGQTTIIRLQQIASRQIKGENVG